MLSVTICDDEPEQTFWLETLVRQWARERKAEVDIACCRNGEQFLFWQEERHTDIALLDIDMPGMDGIGLARRLREMGDDMQILFVTGHGDYAVEGYEVEAVSYLMKPVGQERMFQCLDRARERCGQGEPALLLQTPGGVCRVKLKDVCYLESVAHDTLVYCARVPARSLELPPVQGYAQVSRQTYTRELVQSQKPVSGLKPVRSSTGIGQMEEWIGQQSKVFFRIHRSFLVHLGYVARITRREVVMDDGRCLPVARGRWEALNQVYLDYYRMGEPG